MKVRKYILLLIIAATAIWSCDDDREPAYVRQDKMDVRIYPITSLEPPSLLPDGSVVTVVLDAERDNSTMTPGHTSYCLVKLGTDGTITKSPGFNFKFGNNEQRISALSFDDDSDLFGTNITETGDVFFKYISGEGGLAVASFSSGSVIDESTTSYGKFIGCAPLNDGSIAVIHGNQPQMLIRQADGTSTSVQLPYIYCNDSEKYEVYNICGNVMIYRTDQQDSHDFYVFSPSGELLNYGSTACLYDDIINIVDPDTRSASRAYAITSGLYERTDDGIVQYCIVSRLDSKGSILYNKVCKEIDEIYNVSEHDGRLLCTGYYVPMSYEFQGRNFNETMTTVTSASGKILTLDAETGDSLATNTISLEGGVNPYATVPDGSGGYYIYLSRIFSFDVAQMGESSLYTNSIYIYHVDDLNKLNIE